MLNGRQKFKEFLEQYGRYVIYIRRDLRYRCVCYVERSGDSSPSCPYCFGTGYKVSIEKHITRELPNAVPLSLSGVNQSTPLGNIVVNANVYYFDHTVEPTSGDLVIEVDWENDTPKKIKYKQLISLPEPKYGANGEVVYYSCYTKFVQEGENDHVTSIS